MAIWFLKTIVVCCIYFICTLVQVFIVTLAKLESWRRKKKPRQPCRQPRAFFSSPRPCGFSHGLFSECVISSNGFLYIQNLYEHARQYIRCVYSIYIYIYKLYIPGCEKQTTVGQISLRNVSIVCRCHTLILATQIAAAATRNAPHDIEAREISDEEKVYTETLYRFKIISEATFHCGLVSAIFCVSTAENNLPSTNMIL